MDTGNVSLADIAAVTDKNDGMFGGGTGGMWIFALLILLLIGGGGFFGNRSNFANGEPVTEAGLCNAMNFNNLENAVGRLGDSQQIGFTGLQRDLCQGFSAINAGINQARFDSQQGCCETQRAIDGVKYSGAINTAAIQATSAENTQKILDAITGNRIAGQPVTEAGLCNAMNFNNLENAVGRLGDSQQQGFTGLQRDLCQGFAAINAGINQARFDSQQCCCEIQRAIDGVKYSGAINTAAIQATSAENTQKILDAITGNRIADMQNQINQLQLQNSLCGVVRYPTMSAYNSGSNPFCGCGNHCCNI